MLKAVLERRAFWDCVQGQVIRASSISEAMDDYDFPAEVQDIVDAILLNQSRWFGRLSGCVRVHPGFPDEPELGREYTRNIDPVSGFRINPISEYPHVTDRNIISVECLLGEPGFPDRLKTEIREFLNDLYTRQVPSEAQEIMAGQLKRTRFFCNTVMFCRHIWKKFIATESVKKLCDMPDFYLEFMPVSPYQDVHGLCCARNNIIVGLRFRHKTEPGMAQRIFRFITKEDYPEPKLAEWDCGNDDVLVVTIPVYRHFDPDDQNFRTGLDAAVSILQSMFLPEMEAYHKSVMNDDDVFGIRTTNKMKLLDFLCGEPSGLDYFLRCKGQSSARSFSEFYTAPDNATYRFLLAEHFRFQIKYWMLSHKPPRPKARALVELIFDAMTDADKEEFFQNHEPALIEAWRNHDPEMMLHLYFQNFCQEIGDCIKRGDYRNRTIFRPMRIAGTFNCVYGNLELNSVMPWVLMFQMIKTHMISPDNRLARPSLPIQQLLEAERSFIQIVSKRRSWSSYPVVVDAGPTRQLDLYPWLPGAIHVAGTNPAGMRNTSTDSAGDVLNKWLPKWVDELIRRFFSHGFKFESSLAAEADELDSGISGFPDYMLPDAIAPGSSKVFVQYLQLMTEAVVRL